MNEQKITAAGWAALLGESIGEMIGAALTGFFYLCSSAGLIYCGVVVGLAVLKWAHLVVYN